MGLLDRLRGDPPAPSGRSLADDARAMRTCLDGVHRELSGASGSRHVDVRALVRDLLAGEVAAPTADVAALVARDTDPDDFYERELAPSWDGLGEAQRAARLEGLLEMCSLLEQSDDQAGIPAEMGHAVRTKTLVLAWAFDETYDYISRIARGEALQ
jgi:hypothetical protein